MRGGGGGSLVLGGTGKSKGGGLNTGARGGEGREEPEGPAPVGQDSGAGRCLDS